MRKLFSVLSLVLIYVTIAFGQAEIDIPLSGTDGTTIIPLAVGLDLTATPGIDPGLGESDLPPFPPAGVFDIRFDLQPYAGSALSTLKDYRNSPGWPYTGTVQHTLWWQTSGPGLAIQFEYALPAGAVMTITDQIGGSFLNIGPFVGTGVATIPGSYTAIFAKAFVVMEYTNISPPVSGPGFSVSPTSLDFGTIDVGTTLDLVTTVTNTGTADLVISSAATGTPEFSVVPATATIIAGGTQDFTVTFAPTAVGSYADDLTFTHNAPSATDIVTLTGDAVPAGLVDLENTFSGTDGTTIIDLATGLDASATNGIDPGLGESDLPPFPPAGVFDIRFDLQPYAGSALSTLKDYRFAADPLNFNGVVEHTLWWQTSAPGAAIELQYNLHPNASMIITDQIGGSFLNIGPFTGAGMATIPGSYTAIFAKAFMTITYATTAIDPPGWSVAPTSLNFGNVYPPLSSSSLDVTVTNVATGNPQQSLVITSATIAEPEFTVTPSSATIAPGASQIFTVTFTPPALGSYTGTLVFDDNAGGHIVALSGSSTELSGLIFEEEIQYRIEDASYVDNMQLIATPFPINSLQFRLYTNQQTDDATILSFLNIQKGGNPAVADPSWVLDYNIFRGPITGNGASQDVIYVLLYNTLGLELAPGSYPDLLQVNYRVARLSGVQDSIKSSFVVSHAEASTIEGFDVDITPSREELQVIALNTKSGYGDVNGDGCIDILDLILVVDHIVGRDSLDADEFARADIAPWLTGAPEPTPDGFVNVQDLSLIQNIILTGFFPDGTPVQPCGGPLPKFNGEADATVNIYINSEGISAYLDSKVGIRGAQIEFGSMNANPSNLVINTPLGQGYYLKVDDLFRTLMYDRLASKYIEQGTNRFLADMPFVISNPEEVTLNRLILVDINKHKVMNIEVNVIYGTIALPYDYVLYQNYPNPFNPSTAVKFQVPKTSDVTIKVYDMLGQEVRTLFAGEVLRGTYTTNWDGLNDAGQKMSSGSYIYRMIAGEFAQSKKMVLLK